MAVATTPTMAAGNLAAVPVTPNPSEAIPVVASLADHTTELLPEGIQANTINTFWQKTTAASELVSTSITQTWTDQAIKCYVTCADCSNCSIPRAGYNFTCQMNNVVPALLATIGTPDDDRIEKMTPILDRY